MACSLTRRTRGHIEGSSAARRCRRGLTLSALCAVVLATPSPAAAATIDEINGVFVCYSATEVTVEHPTTGQDDWIVVPLVAPTSVYTNSSKACP